MKNMVKLFGIIALTAVIVCTMAACDSGGDGDDGKPTRLQPKDVTITIKNTSTGGNAANITGVKVYTTTGLPDFNMSYLIGTEYAYDTSYTVATNGTPVTLPKVTVPVHQIGDSNDYYRIFVDVTLWIWNEAWVEERRGLAQYEYMGQNLSSTLTLDLVIPRPGSSVYRLKAE